MSAHQQEPELYFCTRCAGYAAGIEDAAKVCADSAKRWRDFASMGLPAMPDPAVCKVFAEKAYDLAAAIRSLPQPAPAEDARAFHLGDCVTKLKGSAWTGKVVGFYSTTLTPEGYAVESENEPGSVQIYPRQALTGTKP